MNLPADPDGGQDKNGVPGAARVERRQFDRQALDRIFGTEPTSTKDDISDQELPEPSADDRILRERPPHHGG
jgi:hypothetical protein